MSNAPSLSDRLKLICRVALLLAAATLNACGSGGGGGGDSTDAGCVLLLLMGFPFCSSPSPPSPPSGPLPPSPPPITWGQQFDCAAGDVGCLIQAINAANADTTDYDIINLAAGTYTLTAVNNTTDGPNGLPSITSYITLNGAADSASGLTAAAAPRTIIERDASAQPFRLLHNAYGGLGVDIQGISFRGGNTVTGEPNIHGGAIFNRGRLKLHNSTVSGNRTEGSGGGIFNAGHLNLSVSTVSENDASADGGISNSNELNLTRSTVSNNTSFSGGGGIGSSWILRLGNSTVSGNSGGGIFNAGYVSLLNSTVSGNSGGGIFNSDNPNLGGDTMRLTHTIVAGNLDQDFGPDDCTNNGGTLTSLGHNLVGAGTGCPSDGPGDQTVDPATVFTEVLGPLLDNGGPTYTHALLPGGPAIDAGEAVCTNPYVKGFHPIGTDQRGLPRPVDGNGDGIVNCDIGALERAFESMPDLVVESLTHAPSNPSTLHQITFSVSVKNVGTTQAGPSTLALWVSEEGSPALFSVPTLPVDGRHSVERQVMLAVAQTYLATAVADVNGDVPELKEANNQKQEEFVVREGALGSPLLDQEQPLIDSSVGGAAIGGGSEQMLAQVVTASVSGMLTEVRFPVSCHTGDLIVEIQRVAGHTPNGVVLTSQTIPGTSLPSFFPDPPSFRSLVLSAPVFFPTGSPFAIVLRSAGGCGVFRGPSGDPYPGGDGFFDARPNFPGIWVRLGDFGRSDLPFQTLVTP